MNQRQIAKALTTLLIASIIFAPGNSTYAQAVDEAHALERATMFHKATARQKTTKLDLSISSPNNEYYGFNNRDGGWVIVSGDDRTQEILAYSPEGHLAEDNLPDGMRYLLTVYQKEIQSLRTQTTEDRHASMAKDQGESIQPLLGNTAWDQLEPYNRLCPKYWGASRAATGCAATGLAQIMFFHKYPAKGTGSHTYTPTVNTQIGPLTVDFSNSEYRWDSMLPAYDAGYTDEEADAVARLMYDCGVGMDMEYGAQSGADVRNICHELVDYFGYDASIAYRSRQYYSIREWENIIRGELEENRPVFYTGFTENSGGHAFVLDGCDAQGFFHINWGWSGMSNGYFRTTALTPPSQGTGGASGGFNNKQVIITGIMPQREQQHSPHIQLYSTEALKASSNRFSRTPGTNLEVRLGGKIGNGGWQDATVDFQLGLYKDGQCVRHYPGDKGKHIAMDEQVTGISSRPIAVEDLPTGSYILRPEACVSGYTECFPICAQYLSLPNYLVINVTDTSVEIGYPDYPELKATDVNAGNLYQTVTAPVSASISNVGSVEYYGNVNVALLNPTTQRKVAEGENYLIDLMPGEKTHLEMPSTFSAKVPAGKYLMAIVDEDLTRISDLAEVELLPAPEDHALLEATEGFRIDNASSVDPKDIRAYATVICTQGIFSGGVGLYIYDESERNVLGCVDVKTIFLENGEEGQIEFCGYMENAVAGQTYCAKLVNMVENVYLQPRENAKCLFTVSDFGGVEPTAPERDNIVSVFTIDGKQIQEHGGETHGVFIIRYTSGKTAKIIR